MCAWAFFPIAKSEAAATIIALSGGNMISGDRLVDLSPSKLEILKKITPSFGEAAVPVDLFDTDMPSVFALKIKKAFGEWTVVGFFNASLTKPVEKRFSLQRLSLDSGKRYLAFDFWKQQFLGEVSDEITCHHSTGKRQVALAARKDRQTAMGFHRSPRIAGGG